MNPDIGIALSIIAWIITAFKFATIQWKKVRKDGQVVLNYWLTMLCVSFTLTFLVEGLANFFDAHTFNNLSRLIAYCSAITGLYFSTVATLYVVKKPSGRPSIGWIKISLILTLFILMALYARFIWAIPQWKDHHVPQSLPEAAFMFTMFVFAFMLCVVLTRANITFLHLEKSAVMRLRVFTLILTSIIAGLYFGVKIVLVGGYFLPILANQTLISLSLDLLVLTALLWIVSLLSNNKYVRVVVISRNIWSWKTYCDLLYMKDRLLQLCPEVALSPGNPPLWKFMLNPEYYLYRAIIVIMDSKAMLADFLSDTLVSGEPSLWEGDQLQEAIEVNRLLQSVSSVDDFWKIVKDYQRVSRVLLSMHNHNKLQQGAY